jgi:hypothetical protein
VKELQHPQAVSEERMCVSDSTNNAVEFSTSIRSYRPDIDGLRAIAILSVVLYHTDVHLLPGGFTGVDVFLSSLAI